MLRSLLRSGSTGTLLFAALLLPAVSWSALPEESKAKREKPAEAKPAAIDPADDPDFKVQGEYEGKVRFEGLDIDAGVQIIALGKGHFHGVFYVGGLPGRGFEGKIKFEADGDRDGESVVFGHEKGTSRWRKDETVEIFGLKEQSIGKLKKIERRSPTLGKEPPEGAVVIFDGKCADAFKNGKISPEGWLMEGSDTLQKFGDCTLHLEFRTPYMPGARGQARGNSGCYLQSRYEVQILDSFGLAGKNNECGGLYEIKDPDLNMCFPPLSWQTYDIDFTAAKFDAAGTKTADAKITVRHNGVVVQNDAALPRTTRAAPLKDITPETGPLHLQNHGNPVRFRNIWLVEKK